MQCFVQPCVPDPQPGLPASSLPQIKLKKKKKKTFYGRDSIRLSDWLFDWAEAINNRYQGSKLPWSTWEDFIKQTLIEQDKQGVGRSLQLMRTKWRVISSQS